MAAGSTANPNPNLTYPDPNPNLTKARQHAGFQQHRHDQSILSLLAKRHRLKTFPLPTAAHDRRDIWAWEAGYCEITWPLPSYRPAFDPYVTHYKVARF